ncbi:MAG: cryptochrome/photolyase family protein [Leptothrix sp. (in: b-proteobacteria)]
MSGPARPPEAGARPPDAGASPAHDAPAVGLRHLVVVLGDQLDLAASAFDGFDPRCDRVWMAEVMAESTQVWSSKQRSALFLSAMRHFAEAVTAAGWPLDYTRLAADAGAGHASADAAGDGANTDSSTDSLAARLLEAITRERPQRLVMTAPGEWRVWQAMKGVAQATGVPLEVRDDRHFYATVREFATHAQGRKSLRLETFYREMRVRHQVLMDAGPTGADALQPAGGQWNFDADNRESFGPNGPGFVPPRSRFEPDAITREVIDLVNQRLASHPGSLADFAWPVTRAQALQALDAFIDERLAEFGRHQDAIWPGEPWLHHAHLSAALNLKLLNPREVVDAAEAAYRRGRAPLASVEGFIRQVLGWREYVRGIYWTRMPRYEALNALDAHEALPAWYWTGATDMACLRDAITQTLTHGYAHHIQRLMVTGLYALLLGVEPQQVHRWYLAVYVDAVEWVELPNVFGMSQYADADGEGGPMASKPYIASGKYIDRMSPHCKGCRYDPAQREGARACPFTTLYWDFLMRHEARLARNPRTAMQVRNLARLTDAQKQAIGDRAGAVRRGELGHAPTPAARAGGTPTQPT